MKYTPTAISTNPWSAYRQITAPPSYPNRLPEQTQLSHLDNTICGMHRWQSLRILEAQIDRQITTALPSYPKQTQLSILDNTTCGMRRWQALHGDYNLYIPLQRISIDKSQHPHRIPSYPIVSQNKLNFRISTHSSEENTQHPPKRFTKRSGSSTAERSTKLFRSHLH